MRSTLVLWFNNDNTDKGTTTMKTLKLNNGYEIPVVGTGTNTFGKEGNVFSGTITYDTTELRSAIELGYRLIDTAIYYRNEAVIGKAVKESGIDRSEFFITSKIPEKVEFSGTDELVRQYVDASLDALDLGYIDLYLIHFPLESNEENLRVWRVLEEYVNQGLIRSIGVSNFNEAQLAYVLDHCQIKPVLNQFLSYPGHHNQSLIDYCKANDVIPEAYQSLKKVDEATKALLTEIGLRYQKTWSQIILNYQVHQGIVVIPKSHNPINQANNIQMFDFSLTPQDVALIKSM
jgi:diketogulonate reductase-like aldo/keto reductase